jgi:hypothetical protein
VSGVNGKLRRVGDAYNRGHYIENQRNWAKGMNSWDWAGVADATLGIVGGGLDGVYTKQWGETFESGGVEWGGWVSRLTALV